MPALFCSGSAPATTRMALDHMFFTDTLGMIERPMR
jgi:hypothetical protein